MRYNRTDERVVKIKKIPGLASTCGWSRNLKLVLGERSLNNVSKIVCSERDATITVARTSVVQFSGIYLDHGISRACVQMQVIAF